MQRARQSIADLQRTAGSEVPVRIAVGSVKDALLEAVRQSDADVLMIGRSPRPGALGRMRDLTYAVVRDSPFPCSASDPIAICPSALQSLTMGTRKSVYTRTTP